MHREIPEHADFGAKKSQVDPHRIDVEQFAEQTLIDHLTNGHNGRAVDEGMVDLQGQPTRGRKVHQLLRGLDR